MNQSIHCGIYIGVPRRARTMPPPLGSSRGRGCCAVLRAEKISATLYLICMSLRPRLRLILCDGVYVLVYAVCIRMRMIMQCFSPLCVVIEQNDYFV